jgi:membrane peptidoglycan carboxypeptidase
VNASSFGATSVEALKVPAAAAVSVWFLFLAYVFRRSLLDLHETSSLLIIKSLARMLQVRLVVDFGYTIYRAKLARFELMRLVSDTTKIEELLVAIEDRRFRRHHGIDLLGIGRAI